jgi:hypothetical protein
VTDSERVGEEGNTKEGKLNVDMHKPKANESEILAVSL